MLKAYIFENEPVKEKKIFKLLEKILESACIYNVKKKNAILEREVLDKP